MSRTRYEIHPEFVDPTAVLAYVQSDLRPYGMLPIDPHWLTPGRRAPNHVRAELASASLVLIVIGPIGVG